VGLDAVIFDWGGTLNPRHTIDGARLLVSGLRGALPRARGCGVHGRSPKAGFSPR
jgi:hypothetical protein